MPPGPAPARRVRAQRRAARLEPVELPQRLRIQTIDSLAHEVARDHAAAGPACRPASPSIDDAAPLYARRRAKRCAMVKRIRHCVPDVDLLLQRLDNNLDQAQQLLAELLPGRNRWLPWLLEHRDTALAERVAASLAAHRRHDAGRRRAAAARGVAPGSRLDRARQRGHTAQAAGQAQGQPWSSWLSSDGHAGCRTTDPLAAWRAVVNLLLTDKDEPRKPNGMNVRLGFPPTDKALKAAGRTGRAWSRSRRPAVAARLHDPHAATSAHRSRRNAPRWPGCRA